MGLTRPLLTGRASEHRRETVNHPTHRPDRPEPSERPTHFRCSNQSCSMISSVGGRCPRCGSGLLAVHVSRTGPQRTPRSPSRRSAAWLFWLLVTAAALAFTVSEGRADYLAFDALIALYTTYLYRGGRFVFVPIPGCLPVLLFLVVAVGTAGVVTTRWI